MYMYVYSYMHKVCTIPSKIWWPLTN